MLAIASKSGRYDRLVEGDMVTAMAAEPDRADLVVCSGATYYLQDLAPFLAAVHLPETRRASLLRRLSGAGGHGRDGNHRRQPRYCRSAGLTRALAAEHGFAEIHCVLELSFNLPAFHWHFRKL